ncbi:dehydrogenase [Azorhizobium oxalatiphilum]|uniref:Dehydrogenase n=1 Tax=Azorhizobium oxalatiphilum TaxID=980631 RepID=A0A917BIU3_9HYPH|nr:zinc-binding alcohol dehydrogenase [Azorhizobium oxalatiphilum]GGF46654.1 dehydrogenase [Azorhizobium oxalatiphilum]
MKAQIAPDRSADTHASASALWYVEPRRADLRREPLPDLASDELLVATEWSALSRGTERLVFSGRISADQGAQMRAPMQGGEFPFPVKYGYCTVGRVEAGSPRFLGRHVFVLHPHQDRFVVKRDDVLVVPDGVPARRATLAANMETALNALWDSGAGAGDRIVVVGAGLIGLLITFLAARLPGAEVTAVDPDHGRAKLVHGFGARFAQNTQALGEADVVFHTSACSEGLNAAIACCGSEATLVEVSWYGDRDVTLSLGGSFHARRLRLVSSQVGAVPPGRAPRWSPRRRLAKALDLLADPRLDALITEEVAFADLPGALERILGDAPHGVATVVRYP